MTITDIVEFDKKRCKVFIDGEFAFLLYKGELRDFGIKTGANISDSTYNTGMWLIGIIVAVAMS